MSVEEFFTIWWKEKQKSRPNPMRKPFGHYINDKFSFAEAYHKSKVEAEIEKIKSQIKQFHATQKLIAKQEALEQLLKK